LSRTPEILIQIKKNGNALSRDGGTWGACWGKNTYRGVTVEENALWGGLYKRFGSGRRCSRTTCRFTMMTPKEGGDEKKNNPWRSRFIRIQ